MRNKVFQITLFISIISFIRCEDGSKEEITQIKETITVGAGSYPFVSYWIIDYPENEVIEAIIELKKENSALQPPNQTELVRGRRKGFVEGYLESWKSVPRPTTDTVSWPIDTVPPHDVRNSYGNLNNNWEEYWFFIDFYYEEKSEIIHAWTRSEVDSNQTTIALIGFREINELNDIKLINRDFGVANNNTRINYFKANIVDKVLQIIKKKGN